MQKNLVRHFFIFFLNLSAAAVFSFLTLVALELSGLESCTSPQPGWLFFSVFCALCSVFPSYIHQVSFLDIPLFTAAKENLKAPLIICMALDAIILIFGGKIPSLLGVSSILLPLIIRRISYLFSILLIPASYFLSRICLPLPDKTAIHPNSLKFFRYIMIIIISLIFVVPFFLPGSCTSLSAPFIWFFGVLHWLCLSALFNHGEKTFISLFLFLIIGSITLILFAFIQGQPENVLLISPILLLQLCSLFFLIKEESLQWICDDSTMDSGWDFEVQDVNEVQMENQPASLEKLKNDKAEIL